MQIATILFTSPIQSNLMLSWKDFRLNPIYFFNWISSLLFLTMHLIQYTDTTLNMSHTSITVYGFSLSVLLYWSVSVLSKSVPFEGDNILSIHNIPRNMKEDLWNADTWHYNFIIAWPNNFHGLFLDVAPHFFTSFRTMVKSMITRCRNGYNSLLLWVE